MSMYRIEIILVEHNLGFFRKFFLYLIFIRRLWQYFASRLVYKALPNPVIQIDDCKYINYAKLRDTNIVFLLNIISNTINLFF